MNFLDSRLPDRFWSKCIPEPNSGCWLWFGAVGSFGYGNITLHQRSWNAHRLAFVTLVGPVASGLHLDHRCRVTSCCNPAHLEAVEPAVNVRRGGDNLYLHGGRRHCRACRRAA